MTATLLKRRRRRRSGVDCVVSATPTAGESDTAATTTTEISGERRSGNEESRTSLTSSSAAPVVAVKRCWWLVVKWSGGIHKDVDGGLHYGLTVANAVDWRVPAAETYGARELRNAGLAVLARQVLGADVVKPRRVTLSNWDNSIFTLIRCNTLAFMLLFLYGIGPQSLSPSSNALNLRVLAGLRSDSGKCHRFEGAGGRRRTLTWTTTAGGFWAELVSNIGQI
ncbi:hypothetical protein RHGRI_034124 [Rhododendron griersonianum]|uniref:Uncharacterized protein n=1 Tax=Rhododendron griersonianum TaxID=479676 RepID=A0AAV6HZT9_9ERIC|nr:hypothetical protein RHGRI_034124 [Rhododendron griersonianum]